MRISKTIDLLGFSRMVSNFLRMVRLKKNPLRGNPVTGYLLFMEEIGVAWLFQPYRTVESLCGMGLYLVIAPVVSLASRWYLFLYFTILQ